MTYLGFSAWFLLLAAALTYVVLRRAARVDAAAPRRWFRAAAGATTALLVLTAVFDNVMIAAGFFSYREDALAGPHLGLAPIEDFAYPLVAGLLLGALWEAGRVRGGGRG